MILILNLLVWLPWIVNDGWNLRNDRLMDTVDHIFNRPPVFDNKPNTLFHFLMFYFLIEPYGRE